ncbi:protein of unknown function [Magnetospirillum sp. XM-1]|uniref:hypothetical protein n=1 Tax=Magnetospirillum sp. XM-1 TaxID=1663591 RepID=UPI00073DF4B8|nr:hypothetical protein [Magnetospirillum sp. XM-1]CUW39612.1 protein of unknown function [Magnetospirillum sp. XM-1]
MPLANAIFPTDRPSNDEIAQAAHKIFDRHGTAARLLAEEWAASLERSASWSEHATALRILSLIERMARDEGV